MSEARLELTTDPDTMRCAGDWTLNTINTVYSRSLSLSSSRSLSLSNGNDSTTLIIDGSAIQTMDTAGAWLLYKTYQSIANNNGQTIVLQGFNPEHTALLTMMATYADAHQPVIPPPAPHLLEKIGRNTHQWLSQIIDFFAFVGEVTIAFGRSVFSPSRIRWQALLVNLQTSGLTAIPIVSLMAFLMGVVIAYQGGAQLKLYGANILIVDLVGITLLRELAPLLAAIIVAGRSGSAYTAQIGTMLVTQEVDALKTLGIMPMDLLVLPKLLALMIALPLLIAWADIMGVFGGMLVANLALDVSFTDFLDRFVKAVHLRHYLIGIGKAPIFAAIIATVGCYRGFQVSGGADSVGQQVTISVVQAIFLVMVCDAIFSIIFSWVRI